MHSRVKIGYIFGLLCGALLLFCILGYSYGSSHTIPRDVTLSGWPLSGQTISQLEQQFKQIQSAIEQQQISFVCDGVGCDKLAPKKQAVRQAYWTSTNLTLSDAGVQHNLAGIMSLLASIDEGAWYKRAWARWQLNGSHFKLQLTINPGQLLQALQDKEATAHSFKPVNAYRKIKPDDSIQIFSEINAYRLDAAELQNRVLAVLPDHDDSWLKDLRAGEKLRLQVSLPLVVKPPSITAINLRNQGITRKISQFSTVFATSAAGRIHNISASAQTMQDRLLAPGEIFDYSKIIRQTEEHFGYQEAPVIYNGKLVPGIGGGICQVSTTLYNAVLRAGLQIIERRNHSLPISYVPLGQDATYASDYINFRFRNNTEHFLLIRTSIVGNALTVKLFGTTPSNKLYEIKSTIVERLQPSTRYLYNRALAVNEQQTLQTGKLGYIVETYRYQKVKGVLTNKELISRDTYPSQPNLVAVGEAGKDQVQKQGRNLLEDGVSGPDFR